MTTLSLFLTLLVFLGMFSSVPAVSFGASSSGLASKKMTEPRDILYTQPVPLHTVVFPDRPRLPVEIGESLLNTGPIGRGIKLPTGAVWQPSFLSWGNYRTALQYFYDGEDTLLEWPNRFDLFGNLALTPSERFFAEVRFLDRKGGFTGYTFRAPNKNTEGFNEELNFDFTSLFFEGDLGELLPFLDVYDKRGLDLGISIGRQRLSFQDGMLLNDNLDAVGISKINLKPLTTVNYRTTFLYAPAEVNRANLRVKDKNSILFGWFNEVDWRKSTVHADVIYVHSDEVTGKGFYGGVGSTQRFGSIDTTFRVLGSVPIGRETIHNTDGVLLFNQIGHTFLKSQNYSYLNTFLGIRKYRSASRGPSDGGPLSGPGILFESPGLGGYRSPLNNQPDQAFGGAVGYQMFFDHLRKQLLLEFGGRYSLNRAEQKAFGAGLRYQMALGRRFIIRFDSAVTYGKSPGLRRVTLEDELGIGSRVEWITKF